MAYKLMYNDGILFEPFSDDVVYDAKLTARYNNPDYLDFTLPYSHSLYSTVAERAGVIKLYFDNVLLFDGEITSIAIDMEGNKSISCDGALAYLQDSLVRPYSTIKDEEQYTAPSTVNGLFQWYIDQHNEHVMDPRKQFTVNINQGASLDSNNYIYRSNTGLPTTWSEINDKLIDSLGGYLFVDYEDTVHILNYYSDVHDNNTQIIDFGVNISDFSKTIDTTDQYTAVRPSGATPEAPEGSTDEQKPITIESLANGGTKYAGITKKGDVVYSIEGVARYGYREYNYSNTDITTQEGLLESACRVLNNLLSPTTTITVKAVDLSLYMEGYTHLKVGEAVRIRSKLHDEDEYLMVNSITLDLQNPGNSEYEIGQAYDTLTGQQSAYLKSLNSGINKSLDSVAALDTKAKETAEVAKTAAEQAEEAKQKAEDAGTTATAAQKAAEAAKTAAEKTVTEAKNAADKATDAAIAADEAKSKVTVIENNVTTKINEFNTKVDASTTASANAEKNASAALDKANDAYTSVGKIQSQVEHIDAAVKDVDTKATNIRDELAGQIETVTNTMTADYTKKSELNETTENLKKTITESAAGVKSEVALTYATKTDLATTTEATEAAKKAAQTAQDTANKNATDLANTIIKYDGKVEDLQSQIDGAIETWFYDGVPTTSNAPAKDWTDDKVKKNHLGDLYYDNKTGYSYRWQVQNGTYSWSRITDVDVTKALANAAKAQDTADNKRRVFVTTPNPPYDQGDLWVQGSGGDIMRCQTAKTSTQSYAASDWVLASKYTDDTGVDTLSNHVSTYYAAKSTVEQLADKWSVTNNSITQVQLDPEAAATEVTNAQNAATEAKNNVTTAKSNLTTAKTNLDTANANLEKAKADPTITYDQLDKLKTAAREAQVEYNAAVDAVTMAEAAVTVANNLVTAAKNRLTAVQNLDNRITSNKTAIETNDKEIKLTASSLSTKIDNVAIGGCNLIQNSTGNLNKTTYWNTESGSCSVEAVTSMTDYSGNCIKFVQSAAGGRFYFSTNMFAHTNGQEYTLTFWAKSSSTVTFGAYEGGTTAITTASIGSSKWTKFQKTYTASTTYSLTLKASAATTVYIAKLKLETGNKATDWTPAPEDLLVNAKDYSDAQLTVTADKINATVKSLEAASNSNWILDPGFQNGAENTDGWTIKPATGSITQTSRDCYMNAGNVYRRVEKGQKLQMTIRGKTSGLTTDTTMNLGFRYKDKDNSAWVTWVVPLVGSTTHGDDVSINTTYTIPDSMDKCYLVPFIRLAIKSGSTAGIGTGVITYVQITDVTSASTYSDAQLTIESNKITSNVSKTYATQTALATTNNNVTTAQNTANNAQTTANNVKSDLANNYTKSVISTVSGNGNSATYFSIATIKVLQTYANRGITITCSNRSNKQTTYNLVFANANSKDPGVATFTRNGPVEAWVAKSTTSTWILYVKKSESYDINYVVGYSNPDKSLVSVTFGGANVASLPTSNIIAAVAEIGSNSATDYYTIKQVDSKITQTETSITGTVSATYATISALNTTNNNVTTAQNTANTAKTNAATAQNTANTAKTNAATAQTTANSKRRVFVATPTVPYDVGDLWVQGSSGDIKRCKTAKTSTGSYAESDWVLASKYTDDTKANNAQTTANSKRRVFVATPTVPYDVGDLWVQGSSGDIKRCKTAKTSTGSYAESDWVLASKYTDDTKANTAIANVKTLDSKVDQQIDKVTTYIRESSGNIMNGTADFSALTGGLWANSAIRVSETATLAHGHNSSCPVPQSDQVTITATKANTNGGFAQDGYADIVSGDTITISCYVKASVANSKVIIQPFWNANSVPSDYKKTITLSDTNWTYVTHTATATVTTTNSIGYVYLNSSTANAKLYVCGIKVERGTFASAWCASSTDLTNYMRFSSSGLEIAKKVNGSIGSTKAVITDSAFQIQNSSGTTLSKFTADTAVLGANLATKAVVTKDAFQIQNSSGTTLSGFTSTNAYIGPTSYSSGAFHLYVNECPIITYNGSYLTYILGCSNTEKDMFITASSAPREVSMVPDDAYICMHHNSLYSRMYAKNLTLTPTLLYSGTLNVGGSVTIARLPEYTTFAVLGAGYTVLLWGMRNTNNNELNLIGGCDNGTNSTLMVGRCTLTNTTFKHICCSSHTLWGSNESTFSINKIYGLA